jgi:SAM-dependent methyltransferase
LSPFLSTEVLNPPRFIHTHRRFNRDAVSDFRPYSNERAGSHFKTQSMPKSKRRLRRQDDPRSTFPLGKTRSVRYAAYHAAVQCPEADVDFLINTFRSIRRRSPVSLGEDFCGTFANCCEWVRRGRGRTAVGIDLDPEPIAYGREHYFKQLPTRLRDSIKIRQANVLSRSLPPADVICALNFSYFVFRDRLTLVRYFSNVKRRLPTDGLFVVDTFGGPECGFRNRERKSMSGGTYIWEQKSFDPVTNEAYFAIHFKKTKIGKIRNAFTYHWRMWSIPEIRDCMIDAGFKDALVYWEGTKKDGSGNGVFSPVTSGEECDVWIAYVVGVV